MDLALATVLAERALASGREPAEPDLHVAPEVLVPRVGEYLVEKGVVTQEQLDRALMYKEEQSQEETPILLGQAMIQLGFINQKILDQAIAEQIFRLQDALKRANRSLERRVAERTR